MVAKTPRKFVGSTGWAEPESYDEAAVDRALLQSTDELVVDFAYEEGVIQLLLFGQRVMNFAADM